MDDSIVNMNFCELAQIHVCSYTDNRKMGSIPAISSHACRNGQREVGETGGSEATAVGGMRSQTVQSEINIHLAHSLPKT